MGFSLVFEHLDACGVQQGKPVKASVLSSAAVLMTSRGADRILVPAPSSYEEERIAEGVASLPRERRDIVKLVDKDGEIIGRIRNYLDPLRAQARKWPEDAFVGFTESFLYHLALGAKHKAGILDNSVQTVLGFVPILDFREFRGEAKFRLAEICSLICTYEPAVVEHGNCRVDLSCQTATSTDVWELLNLAEFRTLLATSGKLGYLKHPTVGLRRLGTAIRTFVTHPKAKPFLGLASTAANISGVSVAEKIGRMVEQVGGFFGEPFRPPFMSLGPAEMGIYRVALQSRFPDAVPPQGTILNFEHMRCGYRGVSWLNVGEEHKLEREAIDLARPKKKLLEARAALNRL
jgi:hypothetical protein